MIKCPLCYKEFSEVSEFEKHLSEFHYLDMYRYYEMMGTSESLTRPPISYLSPSSEMYLPDLSKAKSVNERTLFTNLIKSNLREYYSNIIGDRFFQLFIIDDIYFNSTFSHQYEEFKEVLKILQKRDNRDRGDSWFLDWHLGYPRIVSKENLDGIKTVNVDSLYKVSYGDDTITVNNYIIKMPELLNMNYTNYPKYNLFSKSKGRNKKRIKLDGKKRPNPYLKFYSHKDNSAQSIFSVVDRISGDELNTSNIPKLDLIVLKLILMRSRPFMKLLFEVIEVVCESTGTLSDSVFLRNSIEIDKKKSINTYIHWLPEDCSNDEVINISIF